MTRKFTGSMTDFDGNRRALSEDEAAAIWDSCERAKEKRIADMPDFDKAIGALHNAKTRLGELGWRDAVYCPKNGSSFAIIEYGSTGIFTASYYGKWPEGHLIYDDCVGHPKGCMWKPIEALTEQEAELRRNCEESHRKFMERSFGEPTPSPGEYVEGGER